MWVVSLQHRVEMINHDLWPVVFRRDPVLIETQEMHVSSLSLSSDLRITNRYADPTEPFIKLTFSRKGQQARILYLLPRVKVALIYVFVRKTQEKRIIKDSSDCASMLFSWGWVLCLCGHTPAVFGSAVAVSGFQISVMLPSVSAFSITSSVFPWNGMEACPHSMRR